MVYLFRINVSKYQRYIYHSNNRHTYIICDIFVYVISDDYIVAVSRLDLISKDYETLILGYKVAYEKGIKEKLYIIGDGVIKK